VEKSLTCILLNRNTSLRGITWTAFSNPEVGQLFVAVHAGPDSGYESLMIRQMLIASQRVTGLSSHIQRNEQKE
jgi:hypothetical protein